MNGGDALMPDPTGVVRCAPFTASLEVDPAGTALWVDEVIVVDVALPWPKPVFALAGFEAVDVAVSAAARHGRRVRVLAAVPEVDDGPGRVVHHRRIDGAGLSVRVEHEFGANDLVVDVVLALLADPAARPVAAADVEAGCELLVCTQGSHDVCCGSWGASLVAQLALQRDDVAVRRVSHIGGHRFAPTAMSLPDGRMWGGLDVDAALAVVDRSRAPSELAPWCRGWTGAAAGAAQVAERAVWASVDDWSFDSVQRRVEVLRDGDRGSTVRVTAGEAVWEVDVVARREVPTITCGAVGGLPAKPGLEYEVRRLAPVGR